MMLAIIVGCAVGYYSYIKSKIYTKSNELEIKTIEKKSEDDVDYKEVEGITNVLLVGTDGRDLKESARADSIIIATLDNNNKEIRLTSLFRDTLVDIEGYGPYKLNAAMAFGGIELLKDTIQKTYDISIDKYIIINFWGFEAIIDQIGGLEIDVKEYQLDELNKYIGESTGGNDCPVTEPGLQLLNGKQALSYARIRKGVGDEFERTERQREVLFKVAAKLRETKPTKYLGIVNSMLDYINTNIDYDRTYFTKGNDKNKYKLFMTNDLNILNTLSTGDILCYFGNMNDYNNFIDKFANINIYKFYYNNKFITIFIGSYYI